MYAQIRTLTYAITAVVLLAGCSYQRKVALAPVGQPEGIFSVPRSNNYGAARVGVFAFSEPSYAEGKGKVASQFLCEELDQKGVFAEVIPMPDIRDMTMRNLINAARIKRYDLMITGELLYLFEGSLLEPSSVTEEIRVVKVRGGKPQTLWHAKATETAPPALSTDYIVAQGKGASAPSTAVLMKRNAEKFCNMIRDFPPQMVQEHIE
jgi:hypothetical protein